MNAPSINDSPGTVVSQDLSSPEFVAGRAADVLAIAKAAGATAAQTSISLSTGLTVNVRQGELESVEFQRDQDMAITVFHGTRKASATATDLSPESLQRVTQQACEMAKHGGEDRWAGLADADRMATEFPNLEMDHPWALSVESATSIADEAERAAFDADARVSNSEGGSVDTRRSLYLYANTHGFVGHHLATEHSISCAVIAGAGDAMQRDYWYSLNRRADGLESAASVGAMAAQRAVSRLESRSLSTREVPVLFAAEVARGLFGSFISAISGRPLYQRASFLVDSVGQTLFPEWLDIVQKPHVRGGIGSAAFDNEGVATVERAIVERGRVQGYVLSSYSARRLGLESTGNAGGVFNLRVSGGGGTREQMLEQLGTGLLVTEMMGQGTNLASGDYSRGAAGFWVENGKIAFPVQEVTVAGNLRDMYASIRAIGDDVDTRGNTQTGSVLIDPMTVAGQ